VTYLEWVEEFFKTSVAVADESLVSATKVLSELGLDYNEAGVLDAARVAIDELQLLGCFKPSESLVFEINPPARRFARVGLRETWPSIRGEPLEAGTEALLRAVIRASEFRTDRYAVMQPVELADVLAELPEESNRNLLSDVQILRNHRQYIQARLYGGSPVSGSMSGRYGGAVYVHDEPLGLIAEGRLHLEQDHFRAAGAVLGVEVERRMHELCRFHRVTPRGPRVQLAQDIAALYEKQVITLAHKERLDALAATRNDSVHPRKREPTAHDIEVMIDTTEWFLHEYPNPVGT
jgi:hypothetical protein